MNIAAYLVRAGRSAGARPAVYLGTSEVADFATLARDAAVLAGSLLQGLGLRRGDRVALVMKNTPDYVACLYACWHAGLVAIPVNAKLHAREIAFILDNSGASAVFVTKDLADAVSSALTVAQEAKPIVVEIGSAECRRLRSGDPTALAEVEASAPAWIFYTSGTTGRPKGAVLTHRNLLAMASNYLAEVDHVGPNDAILHAAPMSHGSGLYIVPHVAALAAQIVPESGRFEPAEIFETTAKLTGVSFFAAPTMVHRLTLAAQAGDPDTHGLKTIVYGGGPMYVADTKAALAAFGPKLTQIYGQGESPMTITFLPKHLHVDDGRPGYEERLASVGFRQGVVDVRTVDSAGREVAPGEIGEVVVRGDSVMSGYWGNPQATEDTLKQGWLHTGDLGCFDAEGFLTLKDRSKDVIISGGTNVYPREVEEALLRHPDIAEASVIGRPHEDWGEEIVAFVVAREASQLSAADLDAVCNAWIARFKRPKQYFVLGELPKNNYGKVLKTALRTLLNETGSTTLRSLS